MLTHTLNKRVFILIMGYIASIVFIILLPGIISMTLSLMYAFFVIGIAYQATKRGNKIIATWVLLFPTILSVTQNVYLGLGAWKLNTRSLQVLLSLHFLIFAGIVILNADILMRKARWALLAIMLLLIHSMLLFIMHPAPLTSTISSIRNVLSCMLIYCFGVVMCKRVDLKGYHKWVTRISWLVVLFGLFEWLVGLRVWEALNISRLWELKGIPTNLWGIPPNWYSSEMIGGHQLRRMVSTFADPVNLGTFLFAAFMISWYRKDKVLTVALGICAILTISKGSLLGFLVFIVVFMWQKKKYRAFMPVMSGMTLLIGVWFIRYSMRSSTGSIIAHTKGFLNSFSVLWNNPLGLGVGNVGVLAGLYNDSLLNVSVSETGIGMIIAQLGMIGLVVYIFFFLELCIVPKRWGREFQRERVLYYTLLFSFIANALFNEVALSPNSCCLYFVEIAFLNSTMVKIGEAVPIRINRIVELT